MAIPGSGGASTVTHTVMVLTNGTEYAFRVRAVNPVGNSDPSDSVTATPVPGSDAALTFSETSVILTEAGGAGNTADYSVELAAQPTADVTVTVTSDDASVATVSAATLTFTTTNWNTEQSVTVTGVNDDSVGDRTTSIGHSASGGGYDHVTGAVDVTVTDAAPTDITLKVSPPGSLEESGSETSFTITATLNGPARSEAIDIVLSLAGTATNGADYTATPPSITIPANTSSGTATLSVTPTDDAIVEGRETILVEGTTTVGLSVASATVTLTDGDMATLTLTPASQDAVEGANSSFTVTLSHEVAKEVTVEWATIYGTAGDDDYSPDSGMVSFAAGTTKKTFTIAITDDSLSEGPESFTVALGTATGDLADQVGANPTPVTVNITDNETPDIIEAPAGTLIWKEAGAPVVGKPYTAKWKDLPLDQSSSRSRFYWVVCNTDGSGCVDVPEYESGPTYEYRPMEADVGKVLKSYVFYTLQEQRYKATTELSPPVVAPQTAPVGTLIWKEAGAPMVGKLLTAKWPGMPLDQPPSRSRFYWVVCNEGGTGCVDVPEYESGPTYEYTPVDADKWNVLQAHVFYNFEGKQYKAITELSQPVDASGTPQ